MTPLAVCSTLIESLDNSSELCHFDSIKVRCSSQDLELFSECSWFIYNVFIIEKLYIINYDNYIT